MLCLSFREALNFQATHCTLWMDSLPRRKSDKVSKIERGCPPGGISFLCASVLWQVLWGTDFFSCSQKRFFSKHLQWPFLCAWEITGFLCQSYLVVSRLGIATLSYPCLWGPKQWLIVIVIMIVIIANHSLCICCLLGNVSSCKFILYAQPPSEVCVI